MSMFLFQTKITLLYEVGDCIRLKDAERWETNNPLLVLDVGKRAYKVSDFQDAANCESNDRRYGCYSLKFTEQQEYEKTSCNGL